MLAELFEQNLLISKKKYKYRIFFRLRAKSFRPDFKKTSDVSRGKISRQEKSFKKIMFFWVYAEVYYGKLVETIGKMFKTAIQLSRGAWFLQKNCFWKFVDFSSKSDLEQTLFENFAATFRQLRKKCNPSVHKNILNTKCSFWSKPFFSCLRILTEAISKFQTKLLCQFCQYGV